VGRRLLGANATATIINHRLYKLIFLSFYIVALIAFYFQIFKDIGQDPVRYVGPNMKHVEIKNLFCQENKYYLLVALIAFRLLPPLFQLHITHLFAFSKRKILLPAVSVSGICLTRHQSTA
jgi:hypothetical protein